MTQELTSKTVETSMLDAILKEADEGIYNTHMNAIYNVVNNALVVLEIDGDDLIIRIPYIQGDALDVIKTVMETQYHV